eukprot:1139629-Pelagomonas_calceolata.AAC.2
MAILPTPRIQSGGAAVSSLRERQQPNSEENMLAKAHILLHVAPIHIDAMMLPTAKECWRALENTCMQQGATRRYELKEELHDLCMLPDERMA